ncbi:MAG: zinc-ribbon domain-containing protein, partial [Desulfovibrionaceae bacterium]|nr:zinc-ribbon domain-containing protein [Desulfovibrionaceae bacterium]
MIIHCPHCDYTREMPDERIPDGVVTAHCPGCGKSFPFSRTENIGNTAQEEQPVPETVQDNVVPGSPEPDLGKDISEESTGQDDGCERPDAKQQPDMAEINPWAACTSFTEMPQALYQTCLRVMLSARVFFSSLRPGPFTRAFIFFLAIGCFQVLVEQLWTLLFFNYLMPADQLADPQLKQLADTMIQSGQGSNAITGLFLRLGIITLQLFFFSSLLYISWRLIVRKDIPYSLIVQVLCYASAPLILCVLPGIGMVAGLFWSCAVTFIGLRWALRLTWTQTFLGMAPLLALILFSYTQILSALF